ncbi:MAG: maltokinase N-terminal cap-like domain-containing protein [Acidimicrobiales bacterium]
MALYHKATITPSKSEMVTRLVAARQLCPDAEAPIEIIGAYRFDDPEGRVGMESHLATCGEVLLHVPLTYRDEPLVGAEGALVGEMEHSALGTRWVYDGLGDDRFILMLAAVALTGQGEALGLVLNDGEWFIAPSNIRIRGGGWTQERVSVDGFERRSGEGPTVTFQNDRFELIVHRRPVPGSQPAMGLTASWDGQPRPIVLAEVRER